MSKKKKKTAKKKMGRPFKAKSKMTVRINLVVNPERDARYREAAERLGADLSEWIRRACDAAADSQLGDDSS